MMCRGIQIIIFWLGIKLILRRHWNRLFHIEFVGGIKGKTWGIIRIKYFGPKNLQIDSDCFYTY